MFSKNSKKGQSALEYLMTYGWALVVIVIVIAALVFLIQPSQVGGNTCSTTSGILITNHQVTSADETLTLALSNQAATTLTAVDVTVSGTASGDNTIVANPDPTQIATLGTVAQNQAVVLDNGTTDLDIASGDTYSLNVQFAYQDRDGFARTVTATCNGIAS